MKAVDQATGEDLEAKQKAEQAAGRRGGVTAVIEQLTKGGRTAALFVYPLS